MGRSLALLALAAGFALGQETAPSGDAPHVGRKALENALRNWKQNPSRVVNPRPGIDRAPACGHIRVHRPDPELDSKIVIPTPEPGPDGKVPGYTMPVYAGMQPCEIQP